MEDWDTAGNAGSGFRMGKRMSEKGEVDYKSKAGTAWSHSYLNQKPWHPLSYPNQRRKWIAEQTHANREHRAEEIAREFSQEQEFFRQTALFSNKEKEKLEVMKAVSFMYVRPPGYNAESAKAAEIADEKKRSDGNNAAQAPTPGTTNFSMNDSKPELEKPAEDKKSRPRDVFGRPLPTENEFEVLKNAPRLETGMPARVKPFGIEIRNVRCVRCGTFGHQSGDRECPLKDAIMPNEESRLKRDDPLTTIMAQTSSAEPVKWELKQRPGMSPPRGGFQPDDPNQQIVADEIFDEYGGFLSGGDIPLPLLSKFSTGKSKKLSKHRSKHKPKSSISHTKSKLEYENQSSSSDKDFARETKRSKKIKKDEPSHAMLSRKKDRRRSTNKSDSDTSQEKTSSRKRERCRWSRDDHGGSSSDSEVDRQRKKSPNNKHEKRHGLRSKHYRSPDSEIEMDKRRSRSKRQKKMKRRHSVSSDSENYDSDSEHCRGRRRRHH
ncbi:uncharacterized zinc finger CCHC domain-containing protein At4g19190 isoform X1 [Phalaenopsis equestris]|uniref:uncharacterized zinc finger CCHC domain-containing protein At4g19190 isoform X1 n=1 Tax=Phalaenopsis equestris TaxID=78828 RepID=UPI0009E5EA82|nr:uncharacterized zinc finger CCHC domain-containing protein At4g19190 isoform X1 [Phalaenopsis equestris]